MLHKPAGIQDKEHVAVHDRLDAMCYYKKCAPAEMQTASKGLHN